MFPFSLALQPFRRWTTIEKSGSWEMREDIDTAAGLPSALQKVSGEEGVKGGLEHRHYRVVMGREKAAQYY